MSVSDARFHLRNAVRSLERERDQAHDGALFVVLNRVIKGLQGVDRVLLSTERRGSVSQRKAA